MKNIIYPYTLQQIVVLSSITFALNCAWPLLAQDKEEKSVTEPQDIEVEVPSRLRDRGLRLEIDGQPVDLKQDKVKIRPTLDPVYIDLYDRHERLVDYQSSYVDLDTLKLVKPRNFEGLFLLGSAHPGNSKPWRKIFLSGDRFQFGGEFAYWFGTVGLRTGVGLQNQSAVRDEGFRTLYSAFYWTLSAAYRFVPLRFASGYWRKLSSAVWLGPSFIRHKVIIEDEVVTEEASDTGIGYHLGARIKWPIANNFFIENRYFLLWREIEMQEVDFESKGIDHNLEFGFGYAF